MSESATPPFSPDARPLVRRRWFVVTTSLLAVLLVAVVVASFYVDPIVRSRVESGMNQRLIGYRGKVGSAHLSFFNGSLTVRHLTIVQNAYPNPPVADIPMLYCHVQWRELFSGRLVAEFLWYRPALHLNLIQLRHEKTDKVPLSKKGWQEAIQALYPFKINKFRVREGDVTYVDTDPKRPLHIQNLNLTADNIRNIHYSQDAHPSGFNATATVFDKGRAIVKGHANFLAKPTPTFVARYWLKEVPLAQFAPEVQRVNFTLEGGVLQANGTAEYTEKTRNIEVYKADLQGVKVHYFHTAQTAPAEQVHREEAKRVAKVVANEPDTTIKVNELDVANSYLGFENDAKSPGYKLWVSDLNFRVTNLSNHFSLGPAAFELRGLFMGSGNTRITGAFRPEKEGPDFDVDVAIENTDLPSLNDLLKTYGRFDVASGSISVYSQLEVKQGNMHGYVKPLFTDLKVYSAAQDRHKPVLQQAYEVVVGSAAKLFKNRASKRVATDVNLSGRLDNPKVDTWQALLQFAHNAFVNAILPGFDSHSREQAARSS